MTHLSKLFALAVCALGLAVGSAGAAAPRLVARVDLSSQTMTVSYDGELVHRWAVSTARRGYVTPVGTYRPTRMHRMWYSRKYDNSPMPYSIFFRGGYAVHGTDALRNLGRPASHGCVRLDPRNAAVLFDYVKRVGPSNARIVITR
ncbi:L,D-transpeptidase [Mangrovibrevibacter kandeliae]|uniref:L,D-transpeptidase n=1 Tax=Mangrovibrevibacter kandeliae TaxID=2968473 RepID=UPI0021192445|nr:L,D-transpeptidase [Aurantimonas sp. CSK15Z-1]MCQ8781312.1 L,D-transpeptidase [Aurantimonas sp. CSK15Z-1]